MLTVLNKLTSIKIPNKFLNIYLFIYLFIHVEFVTLWYFNWKVCAVEFSIESLTLIFKMGLTWW